MANGNKINYSEHASAKLAGLSVEELRSLRSPGSKGDTAAIRTGEDEDWTPHGKITSKTAEEGWPHAVKGLKIKSKAHQPKPGPAKRAETRETAVLPTGEQCEILQNHPDYILFKEGMRRNVFEQLKDSGLAESEKQRQFNDFARSDLRNSIKFLLTNGELKDWQKFVEAKAKKQVADVIPQSDFNDKAFHVLKSDVAELISEKSSEKDVKLKDNLELIKPEQAQLLLDKVSIRGHKFKGESLTAAILKQEGLEPKYKVESEGKVVWFSSNPYNLGDGRIAVIGYVDSGNNRPVARTFYRSNSQGVWRYLPEYLMKNGEIDWYGKGHGEESVTLPVIFQKALAEISQPDRLILNIKNPDLIFAGTAREMRTAANRTEPITMLVEVKPEPVRLKGKFYRGADQKRLPPESLEFSNANFKPDFSRVLDSWEQTSELYGTANVEVFASQDGNLKYMFCRDNKGRAWLGGVENKSEIMGAGVRKEWIFAGDLATPAYEYTSQAGGYGSSKDRKGGYVDMYQNYVSKIPIIKEYLATFSK